MRRRHPSPEEGYTTEDRYSAAQRRIKRIKGFYNHLMVYIIVNTAIYAANISYLPKGDSPFEFKYFITAFGWGIGLLGHGARVFGQDLIFGTNWEQKKIREFMDKEKREKWE